MTRAVQRTLIPKAKGCRALASKQLLANFRMKSFDQLWDEITTDDCTGVQNAKFHGMKTSQTRQLRASDPFQAGSMAGGKMLV